MLCNLRLHKGIVAWVIVLVFVSWATPHVSQWIQENTTIYEKIEAACEESVRRAAQGKMEEGAVEQYGEAGELGLDLPESVMAQIVSGLPAQRTLCLRRPEYMQGSRRAWQDLSCRELRL